MADTDIIDQFGQSIAKVRQETERANKAAADSLRIISASAAAEKDREESIRRGIQALRDQGMTVEEIASKYKISSAEIRNQGATIIRSFSDIAKLPLNRVFNDLREGMLKVSFLGPIAAGALFEAGKKVFEFWDTTRASVNRALASVPQMLGVGGFTSGGPFGFGSRVTLPGGDAGRAEETLRDNLRRLGVPIEESGRALREFATRSVRGDSRSAFELTTRSMELMRAKGLDASTSVGLLSEMFRRTGGNLTDTNSGLAQYLGTLSNLTMSSQMAADSVLSMYPIFYQAGKGYKSSLDSLEKFDRAIYTGAITAEQAARFQTSFTRISPGAQVGLAQMALRAGTVTGERAATLGRMTPIELMGMAQVGGFSLSPSEIAKTMQAQGAFSGMRSTERAIMTMRFMESVGMGMGDTPRARQAMLSSMSEGLGTSFKALDEQFKTLTGKGLSDFADRIEKSSKAGTDQLTSLSTEAGNASNALRTLTQTFKDSVRAFGIELVQSPGSAITQHTPSVTEMVGLLRNMSRAMETGLTVSIKGAFGKEPERSSK